VPQLGLNVFDILPLLDHQRSISVPKVVKRYPKKRRKVIYGKLRQELGGILRRLCEYKGLEVVEGTLCLDHIHMCLSIPPKYSVSPVLGQHQSDTMAAPGLYNPHVPELFGQDLQGGSVVFVE
jgi:hypothetical protein